MTKFRVRAKTKQITSQYFDVYAGSPEEALELVRRGEVEIKYERFDDIEEFEPVEAQPVEHPTRKRSRPILMPV